jgi:phytoene dehydrogenase-like protein
MASSTHDAVFVGAGINSLVGAALLAQAGWNVCVLEREDVAGGCIRTVDGLTAPGFTHELMASWHPLFTGSAA